MRDTTSNVMYCHVISISHLLDIVASVSILHGHSIGELFASAVNGLPFNECEIKIPYEN